MGPLWCDFQWDTGDLSYAPHLPKHGMPHSQSSANEHSDSLLHRGRRMRAAMVLILLHITADLHPSCLGKLVLPFGEMPAANSAAVNISLGKQSCAYPAERWLHQTRTEPTNLGTGFKKCCSGPDVHLFCSEKRSPQALCSSQCNTGAEKVL